MFIAAKERPHRLEARLDHFPKFSRLSLKHQELLQIYTKQFSPYSDFNFISLFSWNTDRSTQISSLNNNLVIRMPDYLKKRQVYSLIGYKKIDETLDLLLDKTEKIELVPELVVEAIQDRSQFKIKEDSSNFDYIYSLERLAKLEGGKYKKKRNKSNVFISDHKHCKLEVVHVNVLDDEHVRLLYEVAKQWAVETSRSDGDIMSERQAIARLLEHISAFDNLITTEVIVDGVIKAFSINEIVDESNAICHFEKALKVHHEHINTFLIAETAKKLFQEGVKWVNWEQDLGLEGLKKAKESYHPEKMLKKYIISRAK